MPSRPFALAILAVAVLASISCAADVAVVLDDSKPGTYLVTIGPDGSVIAVPLRVVRVGAPAPPTNPPPTGTPTAFETAIKSKTAAVIAAGGSKTTAAGLSAVYSLVSSGVADGSIKPEKAFEAVKAATDAVLAAQADRDKWTSWRIDLAAALMTLRDQGLLTSKEQIAGALKEISQGIDAAVGVKLPTATALGTAAKPVIDTYEQGRDGKADGILDGIDLAKLIELIKLVMELIKLFGGGT
jgi:hypothetical protein